MYPRIRPTKTLLMKGKKMDEIRYAATHPNCMVCGSGHDDGLDNHDSENGARGMSAMTVHTQAEFDAAVEAGVDEILICSESDAWIVVTACDSSTVTAYGFSTIRASEFVTVHLISDDVSLAGNGHVIEGTAPDLATATHELTAKEHLDAAFEAAYPVPKWYGVPTGVMTISRWDDGKIFVHAMGVPAMTDDRVEVRTLEPLPPVIPDDCEWVLAGCARLGDERFYWRRDRSERYPWRTINAEGWSCGATTADLIDPKPVPKEES